MNANPVTVNMYLNRMKPLECKHYPPNTGLRGATNAGMYPAAVLRNTVYAVSPCQCQSRAGHLICGSSFPFIQPRPRHHVRVGSLGRYMLGYTGDL